MHSLKGTRPYKHYFHKLITKWFKKKIQNSENTTFLKQLSCTMFLLFRRQTWNNSQTSRGFLVYIEDCMHGWWDRGGMKREGSSSVNMCCPTYLSKRRHRHSLVFLVISIFYTLRKNWISTCDISNIQS